jgi:hydroxypyruvate isomerase
MPKFVANISLLFTQVALPERFELAKAAGFVGAEILLPYDANPNQLAQASKVNNCPVTLINTFFDPTLGNWGCGANPNETQNFKKQISQSAQYARALNADFIHVMSGNQGSIDTFIQNLAWACDAFPNQTFLIEPINTFDIPNYVLNDFDTALKTIETLGRANLGLQFDTYHTSRMGLDVTSTYDKCLPYIRHIQISGNPNRTEPDMGEFDHFGFFKHVDASGYAGLIGAEYKPASKSFDWLTKAR